MTAPPILTRQADRAPIFDRAAAKRAGYSDAEIDAYLREKDPYAPTGKAAAPAESTAAVRDKAPAIRSPGEYVGGIVRQGAQGATMGFADEAEAAARAPFSDRSYRDIRDDVRGQNEAFQKEHPYLSFGANLAGGAATSVGLGALAKAAPVAGRILTGSGLVPKVAETATALQKAGAGMKTAAVMGGLTGAGIAPELDDVGTYTLGGSAAGGATAGLLAGAGGLIRGTRNVLSSIGQGDNPAGPIRSLLRASKPEDKAAERVLRSMGRAGQSLDDVEAAYAGMPEQSALSEAINKERGTELLRIARNSGRERDLIDNSLSERAADIPSRYTETIKRNTGVSAPRDARTVYEQEVGAARQVAGPLYESVKDRAIPDSPMATLVDELQGLADDGLNVWSKARLSDKTFPKAPTDQMTVGQLQRLRQVVDDHIAYGADPRNLSSVEKAAQSRLQDLRGTLDGVLKAAGGDAQQKADATMAGAFTKSRAFAEGEKAQRATTVEEISRRRATSGDPKAFQEGSASKLLANLEGVADGEGGQVRNPVVGSLGSPIRRARTEAAHPNAESFAATRNDAEGLVKQLQTRQKVSGNSTTAANLSEMADEFMGDPTAMASAMLQPMSLPKVIASRILQTGVRGVTAQQATQMGRLLSAGLPGQMPPDEAFKILRAIGPLLQKEAEQRATIRGATGAAVVRFGGRSDR